MSDTPWPHFTRAELQCHCGCGQMEMDSEFMAQLENLRQNLGHSLTITSGFRCPRHNAKVASTGFTGPHVTGKAVDIAISGAAAFHLVALAIHQGFTGIGIKQHGSTGQRIIHLDILTETDSRPRPRIWTYA
ncbi:MAG: DUF882 domain-containing protein [Magnetococcales bacterium]|nr:DUF882 domain-containing protein [Magnetococcales bacterium]